MSPSPFTLPAGLPPPDPAAQAQAAALIEHLRDAITRAGGRIGFDRYMALCLYAPGLGYYSAGSRKLGADGDFITAPELSPLFAHCVAAQCAQVLGQLDGGELLEIGGGSGLLAAELLNDLAALDQAPARYRMLEVSPDLRQRQQQTLRARAPALANRVEWIDHLPQQPWQGVVIANEVLDAMPVQRFRRVGNDFQEGYVHWNGEAFELQYAAITSPGLATALARLNAALPSPLADGYSSEINPAAAAWVTGLATELERGLILLADYGFPRAEFYHPDRGDGTLMCHYRQRSHGDPFILPGLQDITAHVDFTAIGEAALDAGLQVAGYTSQASFLLSTGLLDAVGAENDPKARVIANRDVNILTSPAEMGELFKFMALTRGLHGPLLGFARGDRRGRLG